MHQRLHDPRMRTWGWQGHQRIPVLHHHREDTLVGRTSCCIRKGLVGNGYRQDDRKHTKRSSGSSSRRRGHLRVWRNRRGEAICCHQRGIEEVTSSSSSSNSNSLIFSTILPDVIYTTCTSTTCVCVYDVL